MSSNLSAAETPQQSYPVMLDVRERPCLVVGGGRVAQRKVEGLLAAGAQVAVVAPQITPELRRMVAPALQIARREYRSTDIDGVWLAIAATNASLVNAQLSRDAQARGIWVNSADDPAHCSFTLPSVVRQGDLTVSISTNGKSPALARWLRQQLEEEFDASWAALIEVLADVRAEARSKLGTSEVLGWDAALGDGLLGLVRAGRTEDAAAVVRTHLGLAAA